MIDEKCSKCNQQGHFYVNGVPLCFKHEITDYYKHNLGCLEAYLDSFVERLERFGELDKEEIEFLRVVKEEIPEMVEEFPVLFEELNKNQITWENLEETNKLEKSNSKITLLKKEINKLYEQNNYDELSKKLLEFLKEVLTSAMQSKINTKKLNEELYWLRYNFIEDKDEDSFVVSDDFLEINSIFLGNPDYSEVLQKINSFLNKD